MGDDASSSSSAGALSVDVGFDGVFQVGRWTPIRVTAPASTPEAQGLVRVSDVDGRPVSYPLSRDGQKFVGLFQSSRIDAAVRVSITDADGSRMEQVRSSGGKGGLQIVRQETQLWMLVGPQVGFERAAEQLNIRAADLEREPAVRLIPATSDHVPTNSMALDGIQLLVLGPAPLSSEQSLAIRDWVRSGGRLVLAVGSEVSRYRQSPLVEWFPVEIGDAYRERQTTSLTGQITAYVPNQGQLRSLDELELARLQPSGGNVLIGGPSAPVVVQAAYGLGTVTAVGMNLNVPPFVLPRRSADEERPATWGGLAVLCQKLAGSAVNTAETLTAERELQLNPTGVSDLYSQLAAILDHFPQVDRVSGWNVIGLLLLYLLVVGPLDYLLVHKLLHRPQLTWITLPLWVLLASWWATSMAQSRNGNRLIARQIDILDVAADTGTHRVTGWLSLYSPETRRHNISFQPLPDEPHGNAQVQMAPMGRPESGFRGMYRRGGIQLGGAGYEIEPGRDHAIVRQAPIDQWSSLALAGSALWSTDDASSPVAECRIVNDDRGNLIRFDLSHNLPAPLTDWFAVEQLQATFPLASSPDAHELMPGRKYNLLSSCGQKLLRSYLQGEIIEEQVIKTGTNYFTRSDSYDPLSLDPNRLFRILSFHDAVGGASFTHLGNHALARCDFSPLMQLNRVIVCGRLKSPVVGFSVDDSPTDPDSVETFVRLVVPIVRETVPSVNLRVTSRD
ncbi:MAG: hypothetical protein ACK5Q5_18445 [Planctomycetaceae bacterium]